jgi:hypothetical protein
MYAIGLSADDIGHLERLSNPEVRRRLGASTSRYAHHERQNVVAYLHAWAGLLEEQLDASTQSIEPYLEAAE